MQVFFFGLATEICLDSIKFMNVRTFKGISTGLRLGKLFMINILCISGSCRGCSRGGQQQKYFR